MSDIGEMAYSLLLGWMRAVTDWLWSLLAGNGESGALRWFLSNWKLWLVILFVGGVVVDWMMWMVRWRPYRLLKGRFHRSKAVGAQEGETWDSGVGAYEPETLHDSDPAEWTDVTLRTLSEIDPNWAGGVDMGADVQSTPPMIGNDYYNEYYEESPAQATISSTATDEDYWEMTPDELEDPPEASLSTPAENQAQNDTVAYNPWQQEDLGLAPEPIFDARSPAYEDPQESAPAGDTAPSAHFGRPGYWPGVFQRTRWSRKSDEKQKEVNEDAAEADAYPQDSAGSQTESENYASEMDTEVEPTYDMQPQVSADYPLEPENGQAFDVPSPAPTRRRRRGFRESGHDQWEPTDPMPINRSAEPPAPSAAQVAHLSLMDTRPSRLVRPTAEPEPVLKSKQRGGIRTVTGKPAKQRGFFRFTATEDEPITGLPPMQLQDPFLPPAKPKSPDFDPDD